MYLAKLVRDIISYNFRLSFYPILFPPLFLHHSAQFQCWMVESCSIMLIMLSNPMLWKKNMPLLIQ